MAAIVCLGIISLFLICYLIARALERIFHIDLSIKDKGPNHLDQDEDE